MNEGLTNLERNERVIYDSIFICGWTNPLSHRDTMSVFPENDIDVQ